MEYQTPYAPVCTQDGNRIVWADFKLQAESTKSIVSMDEDVSQSYGGGEANDMYTAVLSVAETLCQGWDELVSELASNQIQSPVGTYGVAHHVTQHGRSRRFGVMHKVTQHVSDPPAAAPGWRLPLLRGKSLEGIRNSAAVVSDHGRHGASLVVPSVRGHPSILTRRSRWLPAAGGEPV